MGFRSACADLSRRGTERPRLGRFGQAHSQRVNRMVRPRMGLPKQGGQNANSRRNHEFSEPFRSSYERRRVKQTYFCSINSTLSGLVDLHAFLKCSTFATLFDKNLLIQPIYQPVTPADRPLSLELRKGKPFYSQASEFVVNRGQLRLPAAKQTLPHPELIRAGTAC